jgi:hypothetical protein
MMAGPAELEEGMKRNLVGGSGWAGNLAEGWGLSKSQFLLLRSRLGLQAPTRYMPFRDQL